MQFAISSTKDTQVISISFTAVTKIITSRRTFNMLRQEIVFTAIKVIL